MTTVVEELDSRSLDAIDKLPLSIVPLETKTLSAARLVKNIQLDGVVELFNEESTGSGQLRPDQLTSFFNWSETEEHADLRLIRRLSLLNSYDVFSLRIELRRVQIQVNDVSALRLSDSKSRELARYMKTFTEPLIRQVYGGGGQEITDFDELIAMFERPNREEALRNLRMIADRLNIELIEVPRFLEEYGDVFLSLAYYKEHLDELVPQITAFIDTIGILRQTYQLRTDTRFQQSAHYLEERLNAIIASITGRFESFNQHTSHMWANITAESFRKVRTLITGHHTTVGGVLCGLTVKMRRWQERFSHLAEEAAVLSKADFIVSEMRQGMEKVQRIEDSAPKIADLN